MHLRLGWCISQTFTAQIESLSKEKPCEFYVSVTENGVDKVSGAATKVVPDNCRQSDDTETDGGSADIGSSDGEPGNPPARPHRRNPRTEMGHQNSSAGKPPRAKSQPAISTKEIQRSNRLDLIERNTEVWQRLSGITTFLIYYRYSVFKNKCRNIKIWSWTV